MSSPSDRDGSQAWTTSVGEQPVWEPYPAPYAPAPGRPEQPAPWQAQPAPVAQPSAAGWPPTGDAGRPAAPLPVPPPSVVVAAVLGLLAVVGVLVAVAVGGAGDALVEAGWLATDVDAVTAMLAVPLVAALVGGSAAALLGRGGVLLCAAGAALAVAAAAVLVGGVLADEVQGLRIGLAAGLAAVGAGVAGLAVVGPSRRWYQAGERRVAELAVGRVLAQPRPGRPEVPGRGPGWAVAGAVVAVATVGAAGLVLSGLVDTGEDGGVFRSGSGAGPVPVDESDLDYDPYLDGLARDCADGDLEQCDQLYFESPIGGDYEDYGSSCGARTDEGFYGSCAEDFD
ncbi:hypothetical protein [Blastococcus sp. SYSU D00813]